MSPVLLAIDTLGTGGAERYVVTVANELTCRGVSVIVVSSGGDLTPDLAPQVTHVELPIAHVRQGLPRAAWQLRGVLRAYNPRVVVANSLAVTWIARAAQVRRRTPIVNVAHGWAADRYSAVGKLLRVADHVVAVSPSVQAQLVRGGLPGDRCSVILNGVDVSDLGPRRGDRRAPLRADLGAGPDDLLVTIVGRVEAQKAQHHVMTVAAKLRDSHPRLRFAIVGDGTREDELAAMVREMGLSDRVRMIGLRSDVPDVLGVSDLYLNCSDWEGLPLTTIEAMASGLPVVATRTEGSAQLFTEGAGSVVPVGDTDAMARALSELADRPALRAQMGAVARERALAHFSHQRMVSELAEIIAGVAA